MNGVFLKDAPFLLCRMEKGVSAKMEGWMKCGGARC